MSFTRPAMHARDSSGRQVSLLNDEPTHGKSIPYGSYHSRNDSQDGFGSNSYVSESSTPTTPDLLRSNSYDSRNSNDQSSPLTPSMLEFRMQSSYTTPYPDPSQYDKRQERTSIYDSYPHKQQSFGVTTRPPYVERTRSSFDDDHFGGDPPERSGSSSGKRYPCRFKDSHGCDKSFTTSGHASRHSKIHTAEKAVHCSFQGCQKKFTRADNMKQHLETHYKERSRSASHKSSSSSVTKLTLPAGIKKTSSSTQHGGTSRPSSRAGWPDGRLSLDTSAMGAFSHLPSERCAGAPTYSPQSPATSPKSSYGALDLGSFQKALPVQIGPSSGLDALAAAVACHIGN